MDVYGVADGWLAAKEICDAGWKSFVARIRGKGRDVRVLIVGAMERPSGTAREPDWRC